MKRPRQASASGGASTMWNQRFSVSFVNWDVARGWWHNCRARWDISSSSIDKSSFNLEKWKIINHKVKSSRAPNWFDGRDGEESGVKSVEIETLRKKERRKKNLKNIKKVNWVYRLFLYKPKRTKLVVSWRHRNEGFFGMRASFGWEMQLKASGSSANAQSLCPLWRPKIFFSGFLRK